MILKHGETYDSKLKFIYVEKGKFVSQFQQNILKANIDRLESI